MTCKSSHRSRLSAFDDTRHLKQAGQRARCLARTRRTTPWVVSSTVSRISCSDDGSEPLTKVTTLAHFFKVSNTSSFPLQPAPKVRKIRSCREGTFPGSIDPIWTRFGVSAMEPFVSRSPNERLGAFPFGGNVRRFQVLSAVECPKKVLSDLRFAKHKRRIWLRRSRSTTSRPSRNLVGPIVDASHPRRGNQQRYRPDGRRNAGSRSSCYQSCEDRAPIQSTDAVWAASLGEENYLLLGQSHRCKSLLHARPILAKLSKPPRGSPSG
jgi:hypothetical protein